MDTSLHAPGVSKGDHPLAKNRDDPKNRSARAELAKALLTEAPLPDGSKSSSSGKHRRGVPDQLHDEDEDFLSDTDSESSSSGSNDSSSSGSSKEQIDRMDRMSDQEIEQRGLSRRLSFMRKRLDDDALSYYESRESVLMLDYTPCICKRPIDLHTPLRVLRQARRIKIMICVTCYNESGDELGRTLSGIASNLDAWQDQGIDWREVCVCIVYDGRARMHQSMFDFLQHELHIYDPEMLLATHRGNPVTMHLFEKTVSLVKHASQREHYLPL